MRGSAKCAQAGAGSKQQLAAEAGRWNLTGVRMPGISDAPPEERGKAAARGQVLPVELASPATAADNWIVYTSHPKMAAGAAHRPHGGKQPTTALPAPGGDWRPWWVWV